MRKDKDVLKVPLESEQDFPKFLKRVRNEEKVYLEQLAEGLMGASQLARIEKGQRPVRKNVRDRLLGRLGIASDLYENLLDIEDYMAWECQRNILSAIEQEDTQTAQYLITEYERQEPVRDRIKHQFCLIMMAEVLKQQKADRQEIGDCYEKAVRLTVPNVDHLCIERSLLSIQEINMVLEYKYYHKGDDFSEKCRSLMAFVENTVYDDLSKVKIYPKIAYYYLQEMFLGQSGQTTEILNENLKVCNQAIEMLRNTGRAFYLVELLEIKIKILECIGDHTEQYKESTELANLLRRLYVENELPVYMHDCAYLYRQRWVFYVGDVLRIRRKMYGLTQQELCKGVCSARTLRRTEKMQGSMQQEALGELLRRLGLSKEYQKMRIATENREVLKLRREMQTCRNNHDIERCRELLNEIREKLSFEIPENRQYFMELEASLDWMEGKITKEEFAAKEEGALQCTLNIERLFHADEVYLTEMEMSCIRKRMQVVEEDEKRKYIDILSHFFEGYEKRYLLSDCVVMYEYVMVCVAGELGNVGEYQSATELDKKILRELLGCKRVWVVSNILYDILWNEMEQKRKNGQLFDKEKMTKWLRQCILLSHFCRQSYYENFYYEKLRQR